MDFRNLTLLHAMAFNAVDPQRSEFHVAVLKAGYRLERCQSAEPGDYTHHCLLLEGEGAIELAMADEYEGEVATSSVKWESDLAPFKPKCDILIRATSYAPHGRPATSWPARVRAMDGDKMVVDKGFRVLGPRQFRKGWLGWRVTAPDACTEVPVRWEYAYGGATTVSSSPEFGNVAEGLQLNEVCFSNPLGRGWIERRYFERASKREAIASTMRSIEPARQGKPIRLAAPQIEEWDRPISAPDIVGHPNAGLDAKKMADVAMDYAFKPVGLGVVGRAWVPRLQRAGTYDEAWRKSRWPHLPEDFDFSYWNAAPDDQQVSWPGLDLEFELVNLAPPGETETGFLRVRLPPHRALVALRYRNGEIAPLPMQLDTVLLDTEEMRISTTWRAVFPLQPEVRVCEARFELDRGAPLLRVQKEKVAVVETEGAWQTT